jgi:hypothetical protein
MNPSRSTRCADLIDNYLYALTGAPWQRNFRDVAPISTGIIWPIDASQGGESGLIEDRPRAGQAGAGL